MYPEERTCRRAQVWSLRLATVLVGLTMGLTFGLLGGLLDPLESGVVYWLKVGLGCGLGCGLFYRIQTAMRDRPRSRGSDSMDDRILIGIMFAGAVGTSVGLQYGWKLGLWGGVGGFVVGQWLGGWILRLRVALHDFLFWQEHGEKQGYNPRVANRSVSPPPFREDYAGTPSLSPERPGRHEREEESDDTRPEEESSRTFWDLKEYKTAVKLIFWGVWILVCIGWGIANPDALGLAYALGFAVAIVGIPLFIIPGYLYNRYRYSQVVDRLQKANPDRSLNTSGTLRDFAPLIPYQVPTGKFYDCKGDGQGSRQLMGRDPATEIPTLLGQFDLAMWEESCKQSSFQPRKSWPGWFWAPRYSGAAMWKPPGKFFPAAKLRVEQSRGGPGKPLYPLTPHCYVDGPSYISLAIGEPYSSDYLNQVEWIFLWLQVQHVKDSLNWQFGVTQLTPYGGWGWVSIENHKAAHGLFRTALEVWQDVLAEWDRPPPSPDPTLKTVRGRRSAD